ncbi:hypothetical protein [Verrucomicrobium sp. GAS474]|uniref:hypothetical protein n=1 Tax=Verrucomicrobium sp. GAS474 TaxID=1882831 RepID=UPI0012FFBB0D|nr:hypothetical protein [Verrucomicrobium sp. GAS474]
MKPLERSRRGLPLLGIAAWLAVGWGADLRAAEIPLDLAPVANMGFRDEVAGDGQGGWADQGPENDFAAFDVARKEFGGVPFRIVDPAKNGGKAIVTFRGSGISGKIALGEVVVKPGSATETAAAYLYVLHTLCYASAVPDDPVGTIAVRFKGGETREFPVLTRRDVGDWWHPPALPNGAVAYSRFNGNATVGVYLSQFKIADAPREVESVTFRTAGKAVWIVVGATLSTEAHSLPAEKHFIARESAEWKAADMADIVAEPGSALDLSQAIPTEPVGTHGRVIVNKAGDFAFEQQPDKGIVFWPTTSFFANPGTPGVEVGGKEGVKRFVEAIRRQGYNMVRVHFHDYYLMADAKADLEFNEEHLDLFDYYIACLKENGIYVCMDGMSTDSGFRKGSGWAYKGPSLKREVISTDEGREHYRAGVAKLLTHLNPYTKTRLVDDPIVVVINFLNEVEFYSFGGIPAPMLGEWQAWLRQRYHGDPAALARAWNAPAKFREGMTFDDVPLFAPAAQWGADPYSVDAGLFLVAVEARTNAWFEKTLRDIGYRGLLGAWDMGKQYRNIVSRAAFPVVTMHNYYAHPSDFIKEGSHVEQESSIATAGQYWRACAGTRFADRPFLVTEYGHVFWSASRYEEGLLFGGYSALQGFQGTMAHCASVALRKHARIVPFDVGADPVARANQVMSAFLLGRGDVAPSRRTVELRFDDRYLEAGAGLNLSAGPGTLLSLICRFGTRYDGTLAKTQAYGERPKPIAVINASGGSQVSMTEHTMDVVEKGGADEKAGALVATLKEQGLLPKENLSDPAKGIYQSDTGELLMETKRNTLTVVTPRFEGIATDKPDRRALGTVRGVESTVPASVAVISLDGLPLAKSGRMLLVYNTDALNSGMELSEDHGTLFNLGQGPTLIRTGVVKVAVGNEAAAGLQAWALGFDGKRREKIPCAVENGELRLVVDTARLEKGPTPFFEIARK